MKEEEEILCGGWGPIEDMTDPRLDVMAKFAISKHNKQSNSKLKFHKVVSGDMQIVQGIRYRLVLDVTDGDDGGTKTYETEVCELICPYSREFTYFKPLN